MRFPAIISLLSLFLFCSVLALPLATTESNDLSLTSRSDCEPGEICLVRRKKTNAAKAKTAAKKQAWKDGKAGRVATKKTAGEALSKSKKSKPEVAAKVNADRKDRKKTKADAKKIRADKAKANPKFAKKKEDHRVKNIQKQYQKNMKDPNVKVAFHPGVSNFLDTMKLQGKDRKKAKKYHKGVIKNEMTKGSQKDAKKAVIKSTAHEGGNNSKEPYHITANFLDDKGREKQNTYKDKEGKEKQGPGHHIYVEKGKGPAAYEKAYGAVPPEQRAAQQKAYEEKLENRKKEGEKIKQEAAARKSAKRAGKSAENAAKKAQQLGDKDAKQNARKAKQAAKNAEDSDSDLGMGMFD